MARKKVVLLGSTGSIGCSTLQVAASLPEEMELVGLAAHQSVEKLAEQVRETGVKHVSIYDATKVDALREMIPADVEIYSGMEGLVTLATLEGAEMVLVAIVGTAGLQPAVAAIEAGKDLAIASKEILVMAGELVIEAAARRGVTILPVDSEHNAIFQCLEGHVEKKGADTSEVSRLILTASGGPFRERDAATMEAITLAEALKHPTWEMGRKITIDSATLFNKGLEMIEARWLFGLEMERVDVIVHPQSIVHSMVEFQDGSVLAQLSQTDMCFPIQYAVTYPKRVAGGLKPLNFAELARLDFEAPRRDVFAALDLAEHAGKVGGAMPAVLNAANEVAVDAFVAEKIGFMDIPRVVEKTMQAKEWEKTGKSLEALIDADSECRVIAAEMITH